jgi:hypothetical protein
MKVINTERKHTHMRSRHIDDTQHFNDCIAGHTGGFEGMKVPNEPDKLVCCECYATVTITPPCSAIIDLVEVLKRTLLHGRN